MGLQDFKLMQPDTRLILFGSTVFKLKCKTSHDLRESLRVESREEVVQEDLKGSCICKMMHFRLLPSLYRGS